MKIDDHIGSGETSFIIAKRSLPPAMTTAALALALNSLAACQDLCVNMFERFHALAKPRKDLIARHWHGMHTNACRVVNSVSNGSDNGNDGYLADGLSNGP